LVVSSGGGDLALAGGDDGVTRDQLTSRDATGGLDTKSEGVDIDKDDITQALVTGKDTTMNSSTISNSLVGVRLGWKAPSQSTP